MDRPLESKVCVVTGGGRGIGAAIASAFAYHGARIAILERDPNLGHQAQSQLTASGAEAISYEVDVRDERGVISAAENVVADFGGVDVLVNNAGISRLGPSMSFPLADWQASLDVMVTGAFLCSREFGKSMRAAGGGAIVNISSINGLVAFPMRLAYSAAKAAVVSITKVLAVEWARYGIRVNAVAPGYTETEMVREVINQGLVDVEACIDYTPLHRMGQPEEIAEAVLYLASARSGFVTGQVLAVDGGWTSFGFMPWSWDPDAPEIDRNVTVERGGDKEGEQHA
jgi:NAD(P)-dependent dehydrogenase (short-subunit alcohol dehydrogenase family)